MSSVLTVLEAISHLTSAPAPRPPALSAPCDANAGRRLLSRNTESLLGAEPEGRKVRIMVTMPSSAATDYPLVRDLLRNGMNCMRINCAHDAEPAWSNMIRNLRQAEQETGRSCKIEMDLAGPKLRTGPLQPGPPVLKIRPQR
ncbi:MAG: pyruvate kinase, partial [Acidobacteriia bacterium 12-62-4]